MKSFIGFTCEDRFIGQGCKPDDAGGDDGEITPDIPPEIVANGAFWDFRTQSREYIGGGLPITYGGPAFSEAGVSFDGVDDALNYGYGRQALPGLPNPSGDFTLEFYGLNLAGNNGSVFGCEAGGQAPRGFHVYYRTSPSRLSLVIPTTTLQMPTVNDIPVNEAFHFAIEREGDTFRAYLNGAVAATWTQSGPIQNPNRAWFFARRASGDYMAMSLAACRITPFAVYKGAFNPPSIPDPQVSPFSAIGTELVEGVRTWFNSPSMLRDGGKVLFPIVGPSSVNLHSWDLGNGAVATPHVATTGAGDDHNDGAIIRLASGKYLMASTGHNVKSLEVAIGDAPNAMTENNIGLQLGSGNYSYTNIFEIVGDAIYLFGRGGSPWSARYSRSEDGGITWEPYTIWAEDAANRPYVRYCKTSPTRIDFILTDGHPNAVPTNSVYHGYIEGNIFHKTDGTPLALPAKPSDFTKIHDGATDGIAWVSGLQLVSGSVVACYSVHSPMQAIQYKRAILSGNTWSGETVCGNAGAGLYINEPYYLGGFCNHPTDLNTMFASINDFGTHQLYRLTKAAGVWTEEQLTQGYKNFRPQVCNGALTYLRGDYMSYTSYAGVKVRGVRL